MKTKSFIEKSCLSPARTQLIWCCELVSLVLDILVLQPIPTTSSFWLHQYSLPSIFIWSSPTSLLLRSSSSLKIRWICWFHVVTHFTVLGSLGGGGRVDIPQHFSIAMRTRMIVVVMRMSRSMTERIMLTIDALKNWVLYNHYQYLSFQWFLFLKPWKQVLRCIIAQSWVWSPLYFHQLLKLKTYRS